MSPSEQQKAISIKDLQAPNPDSAMTSVKQGLSVQAWGLEQR